MQLDRSGAELLFQVLTDREEKASVAIACNESFSGWTKTFTDPRLCAAAIVDRLTFGGTSYSVGGGLPGGDTAARYGADRRSRSATLEEGSPWPSCSM
jgi:IstB-like ATP binding protein